MSTTTPKGAGLTDAEHAEPNRAFALVLLSAAAKSGNEGTMRLAAQLGGYPPCERCDFAKPHCRCISAPNQPKAAGEQPTRSEGR